MEFLSKSEFAARMGWSKAYVSKLSKQERLVLAEGGKVDVEASLELIKGSADPSKTGVAERHQRERIARGVTEHVAPTAAVTADYSAPVTSPYNFQNSRAEREHYLAVLAKNEALKNSGELVERRAVENAAYATARLLRDLLLGLPKQIAPSLSSISDPWELERELTKNIRRVLDDAARLSDADLEQAMQLPN